MLMQIIFMTCSSIYNLENGTTEIEIKFYQTPKSMRKRNVKFFHFLEIACAQDLSRVNCVGFFKRQSNIPKLCVTSNLKTQKEGNHTK